MTEFLRQEGGVLGRGFLNSGRRSYGDAENSYTNPVLLFVCMLLTIASIGAVAYCNIILGTSTDMAAAVTLTPSTVPRPVPQMSVVGRPSPDHRPTPMLAAQTMPSPDHRLPPMLAAMTMPSPDHRPPPMLAALTMPSPDHRPPPLVAALTMPSPDHRSPPLAAALTMPSPDHRPPPLVAALTMPSPDHRPPPLVAATTVPAISVHHSESGDRATAFAGPPLPQADSGKIEPARIVVSPAAPPAAPPAIDTLPPGADLHLRIVYRSADPAAVSRTKALATLLQDQNNDFASVTASSGAAEAEGVVYFFPNDRAAAGRIAASLTRMTKRAEPVTLVHSNRLPRPGTVEIRLPFKDGKDLNNEGF